MQGVLAPLPGPGANGLVNGHHEAAFRVVFGEMSPAVSVFISWTWVGFFRSLDSPGFAVNRDGLDVFFILMGRPNNFLIIGG